MATKDDLVNEKMKGVDLLSDDSDAILGDAMLEVYGEEELSGDK